MEVVMLVDTRENVPLLFPDVLPWWGPSALKSKVPTELITVRTVSKKLIAGDYTLEGDETLAAVERKNSLSELAGNTLSDDRPRFFRALSRLIDQVKHPYLYIESVDAICLGDSTAEAVAARMIDFVCYMAANSGVQLLWSTSVGRSVAGRRRAGTIILRTLLAHHFHEPKGTHP